MAVYSENYGAQGLPGDLGSGLYEFGYQASNLPPAEAATRATQYEAGGSGFDFDLNQGLKDLAAIWITNESREARESAQLPVQYRRAENGQLYATDPAYRAQLGGTTIAGIPVMWIALGAAALLAIAMVKD